MYSVPHIQNKIFRTRRHAVAKNVIDIGIIVRVRHFGWLPKQSSIFAEHTSKIHFQEEYPCSATSIKLCCNNTQAVLLICLSRVAINLSTNASPVIGRSITKIIGYMITRRMQWSEGQVDQVSTLQKAISGQIQVALNGSSYEVTCVRRVPRG